MTQLSHSESEENIKKIGREISAAIRTGNCVLLTGLGFSLFIQTGLNENQLPQVYLRELLNRIFNWCSVKELIPLKESNHIFEGFQGLLTQSSLVLAARQIEEHLLTKTEEKQACLKEIFLQNQAELKYIYSLIAQIPFRAYISTGYDTFIEDEYQAIKTPSKLTKYYQSSITKAIEAYRKREPFILKLHGDTENPDDIILSKRASVISYPSELREILSTSSTLLIGFEKEGSDLEDIKRLISDNELVKCWMVVPKGHLSSDEMKQLQENDKITAIEFTDLSELKRLFITIEKLSSGLRTTEIYVSYALEDEKMKEKLMDQLKIMVFPGLEPTWLDGEIGAGEKMEEEILSRLQKAEIILLLISAKYLTSLKDNHLIEIEMTNAVKRHTEGEARVIPVILRPCAWKDTPFFARLQVLPKSKQDKSIKPISNWPNRDQVYFEAALDIKEAIKNWAEIH